MKDILTCDVEGTVAFYRAEEGWGFIQREGEGAKTEFVHHSNIQCSPPYEGEKVVFDIAESSVPDHEHEAVNVRRAEGDRRTGDVLEWSVEPGSWDSRGLVAAHDGGGSFPFSRRDLKPALEGPTRSPRPWYGASFAVAETAAGTRAVDIELDIRYPLQRFAYLGNEQDMIRALKEMSLPERWDYRTSSGTKKSPILYNYLHFTFAKLWDEDRSLVPAQKKIRVRMDIESPLAAFNTGLVDTKYKPIYALFDANEPGHPQPWKFRAFCVPGESHGRLVASHFNPLPNPAQFFHSTAELLYDPDAPLHLDHTHILAHNRNRLPKKLLDRLKDLDEGQAMRTLIMHLNGAIEVAKKRASWNYRTAIPHYFPTLKELQFLLPLCLLLDNQVDAALSVQKTDTGYLGNTVLPLDWAYKSARLVCRPDSDWLAPDQIEEITEGSEIEEAD